jgi:TRAP-type C4-dicarboxylate transport system substrate-binding protein
MAGGRSEVSDSSLVLKLGITKTEQDPQFQWYTRWAADLDRETKGAVKVQMYPAESLGKAPDVVEMALHGEPVIADCDYAYLSTYVPDLSVMVAPYLVRTGEEGFILWKSDLLKGLLRQLDEKGLHVFSMNYESPRLLWTKKPIKSRADVRGIKIRCANSPMWNAVVRVLGGNPTNIAQSETYQALSQGVADGAEMLPSIVYSWKWHEILKYATRTDHVNNFNIFAMSTKIYKDMPESIRNTFDSVNARYMDEYMRLADALQAEVVQKMKNEGVVFSDINLSEFYEAAKDVPKSFPEWSSGIYERMRAEIDAGRERK